MMSAERVFERVSWLLLAAVVLLSLVLRAIDLDHVPGINGDEPQYGVVARQLLRGEPVAMRTGNGVLMNPLFLGGEVLAQALAPASLTTLRAVPAVLSVLAIALAFLLFRLRGLGFAALFATAIAVLPVHLAYARIAWDPSAIPLMMVLALAAAIRLRPLLTLALFLLSLWVHPSTVLSAPILLAPFVAARGPRKSGSKRFWVAGALLVAALAVVSMLVVLRALPPIVLAQLQPERFTEIAQRLESPVQALLFAERYLELISGPTMYRYVPGSLPDWIALTHVAGLFVLLAVCAVGARQLVRQRNAIDLALGGALGVSLVGAYLVVGPVLLLASTERYGLFLTVPTCFVIVSCLHGLARSAQAQALTRFGCAVIGALLLWSFSANYLGAMHHPDPARENTFRTGDVDPKRAALREIVRMRAPGRTALVYAQDWWIYWTLRYLAENEANVRVTIVGMPWDVRFPRDFVLPQFDPDRMQVFAVAWAGERYDTGIARLSVEHADIRGYEPEPILRVHRLPNH